MVGVEEGVWWRCGRRGSQVTAPMPCRPTTHSPPPLLNYVIISFSRHFFCFFSLAQSAIFLSRFCRKTTYLFLLLYQKFYTRNVGSVFQDNTVLEENAVYR